MSLPASVVGRHQDAVTLQAETRSEEINGRMPTRDRSLGRESKEWPLERWVRPVPIRVLVVVGTPS